jgi:hypothetical protein
MNRAFLIIGIPAVGVAAFYAAVLWGRWAATGVALGLTLALVTIAVVDRRRRASSTTVAGRREPSSGR